MKKEDFKLGTIVKIDDTIAEVDFIGGTGNVWMKVVGDTSRAYLDFNLKETHATLTRYFGAFEMKSKSIPLSAFKILTPEQNVEAIKA